jgi:hypothetical protein
VDKCLEFILPSGAAGMAAGMTRQAIGKKIRKLQEDKKIGQYKTKTTGYRFKVWFENEIDYTTFFLVWEAINSWHKPKIIEEDYDPN